MRAGNRKLIVYAESCEDRTVTAAMGSLNSTHQAASRTLYFSRALNVDGRLRSLMIRLELRYPEVTQDFQ